MLLSWLRVRAGIGVALLAVASVFLAPWVVSAAEPGPNARAIERVMDVQDRHTANLMALPSVVGTATGLNAAGQPVVKVFAANAGVAGIPANLEGVPVVVEVTGTFLAFGHTTARYRPSPIGVSTGHPNITAGTIGCRVTDGVNVFALSNNHIYADQNKANIGDNVLQPGAYDGGLDPADAIGTLFDFEPIKFSRGANNVMDAAIALSSVASLDYGTLEDGYGMPVSTTVLAFVGQAVQKYGRTTGQTFGVVDAINATVLVSYPRRARFVDQIIVTPGTFSAGGDSGSLVVVAGGADDRSPVGLLFAGSSSHTICSPIDAVLGRFGVTVDDGAGGDPPPLNDPPLVTITSPADGSTFDSGATIAINFAGTASDTEDGDLTAGLVWTSDLDGPIGAGGSFSTTLSDGAHIITASVTDSGGATGSASISITVGTPPAETVTITKADYRVRNGELKVEATSTAAPIAELNVVGYGLMSYDAGKNLYKFRQRGAADPGEFVTVESDSGAIDIKAVNRR